MIGRLFGWWPGEMALWSADQNSSSRIRPSLSPSTSPPPRPSPAPAPAPAARAGCSPLYILDMANAVASSSRDRPARNRSSMHSLHQHDPHDGVVITKEVHHRSRSESVKHDTIRIINQYEFRLRVGKGQHGEVYLAEDSTRNYMEVVSTRLSLPSPCIPLSSPPTRCM